MLFRSGEKETAGTITEKVINYALTPKETDVLTWVARGKSYPDIGTILTMSEHTVKFHMRNVSESWAWATRSTPSSRPCSTA